MNRNLWDHQSHALDALRQTVGQGIRRIVLQAPTGSGKTLLSAAIVEGAARKGNRMAFVVPAIALVDQTVQAFWDEGIRDVGVIQANHVMTDWSRPVQVCSIQTLANRQAYPEAKTVIFDECHTLHKRHKEWLTDPAWQQIPFIGLSATPWTKGLGKYFETLLIAATTRDLIDKGLLSKFRVFATGHPDLSGVKIVAGDYHEGQLSTAMQGATLTADIIETWKKLWGKDKTLCFAVDRAHAQLLQERFTQAGISCGYQDAGTSDTDRKEIKKKFHNGEFRVITNIGTLTTGVDWDVRCLVLARPTKSEILYTQIIGRALRLAEGKPDALILDHSDTTQRLGFVTDIHHERLDGGASSDKKDRVPPKPKDCKQCGYMKPARVMVCPNCGFKPDVVSGVVEVDGELGEIIPGQARKQKRPPARQFNMFEKRQFFAELLGYAEEKGYKPGWAANKYREKFDVWPNGMRDVKAVPPGPVMRSWIKSRLIAWVKAKQHQEEVTV